MCTFFLVSSYSVGGGGGQGVAILRHALGLRLTPVKMRKTAFLRIKTLKTLFKIFLYPTTQSALWLTYN